MVGSTLSMLSTDTDPITNNTFISDGSPAGAILDMMSQLLQGRSPPLQDIIMVRTALVQSYDLYAPIAVDRRIQAAVGDEDVVAALVALVGPTRANDGLGGTFTRGTAPPSLSRRSTIARHHEMIRGTDVDEHSSSTNIRTALKSIMQRSVGPGKLRGLDRAVHTSKMQLSIGPDK